MKKVICLVLVAIAMSACCSQSNVPTQKVSPQTNRIFIENLGPYKIQKFNFEGHSYIMVIGGGGHQMGLLHNPNCHCYQQNQLNDKWSAF